MKPKIVVPNSSSQRRNFLKATAAGIAASTINAPQALASTAAQLEAYASSTSVAPGQSISFYVSNYTGTATLQTCTFKIVRLGAVPTTYVNTSIKVRQEFTSPLAYINGCNWPSRYTATIPPGWPSGAYVATCQLGTSVCNVMFVVRPAVAGHNANILVQLPFTTAQAYNNWPGIARGGKSLYASNSSGAVASPKVSFDRPLLNDYHDMFYGGFNNFMAWLEQNKYKVDFCSNIDLHSNPQLLNNYQLMITFGHDEYWTQEMRNGVDSFVESGGNLAIFGGNTCWFQARLEAGISVANPYRTLVCYKSASADPVTDPALKTVNWYALNPPRPQNSTIGTTSQSGAIWAVAQPKPNSPFVVSNASHWVYARTGLTNGATFGGPYVGYETDGLAYIVHPTKGPLPTGTDGSPHNFTILGIADATNWKKLNAGTQSGIAVMGLFQNNGTVFNAGTISWLAALAATDSDGKIITTITQNVINALSQPKTPLQRAKQNIYRYSAAQHGTASRKYFFTDSPMINDGWMYEGVAFSAFGDSVPGSIPIYQYYAEQSSGTGVRFFDSTSPSDGQGWTMIGIAYYAYPDSRRGGIPLYEYYMNVPNDAGTNFLYSTDATISSGWTLTGIFCYVPAG